MLAIIPFDTDNILFTNGIADISSVVIGPKGQATEVVKTVFLESRKHFSNHSYRYENESVYTTLSIIYCQLLIKTVCS